MEKKIAWKPQLGTQLHAITATWCTELFFGGARGGGKSDFLLGDYAQDVEEYGSAWQGVIFRKTYNELEELISRSKQFYPLIGGEWKEQKKTWVFSNGASLKFRHIEREADADKYQGHQYPWIGWDELPNWPDLKAYHKLKACLRSAHGGLRKRIRSTGNPGGAGHGAVKEYFIDPCPKGYKPIEQRDGYRMFIPSKLQDNKILQENDPLYIETLKSVGSEELVKAWLDGDWNAIEGAYFDTFSVDQHVISPFIIPNEWHRVRAFDWGYSRPFCVLWGAVSDGSLLSIGGRNIVFPRDSIIIYREYYGYTGKANEGLKLTAQQIASEIQKMQEGEVPDDQVADPAIFDVSTGFSIAEQMAESGVFWRAADNKRVAGWQQIRSRLKGRDERPLIYVFETCKNLIRTLPLMQYAKSKPEDLDTDLEDHAVDTLRYLCMSRPITVDIPPTLKEIGDQWKADFNPHNVRKQIINRKKNNFE